MEVKPVYLVMITENKNNKYYNCQPNGDGTFTVKYGRVGGHESTAVYPMSKWQSQINSKLKKGYVDTSALMQDVIEDSKVEEKKTDKVDEFGLILNNSVREVIKRLFDYANKVVQSAYKVSSTVVTQAMVDKAQEYIDSLSNEYETLDVKQFNAILIKIFTTIPRKMKVVKDYQANDKSEFAKIIEREQETLDAMRGQVYKKIERKASSENEPNAETISILDKMGITMEEASEEDVAKIKKAMGDVANKFYKAWKVTNHETEEKYKKFVAENNIGNVKLTCHGSRNQNWFNILKTGLKIRPAGVITTGNMFGFGLYYSNPDKWHGVAKSIGYTSLGGYWSREYQNCGFLAFFETALGESYDVYSFDSKYYNFTLNKLKEVKPEAWNLFAHGDTNMLRNDEIIIYHESQTTIRYLVEIR
jgi:poly [ADP-ribose] polymerase